MPWRKAETTLVDAQNARDRLLLGPFACVALVGAGAACQLARSGRTEVDQRLVESQAIAGVHGQDFETLNTRFEQTLYERVAPLCFGSVDVALFQWNRGHNGLLRRVIDITTVPSHAAHAIVASTNSLRSQYVGSGQALARTPRLQLVRAT
jgi:hypothetical protein